MNPVSKLIRQYLTTRQAPETEEKIRRWLTEEKHSEEKDKALREYWDGIDVKTNRGTHRSLAKMKKRLGMNAPARTIPFSKRILRAAAILLPLLMVAGGYFYANRAIPVKEITTSYGERKQITLPDGSEVWLGAGSRLSFGERFVKTRTIRLSGEAHFSVIKDPAKPFIVETEQMSVQALGTEFNITAYPEDDKASTALASGKILVAVQGRQSYILSPGQQLSVHRGSVDVAVGKIASADIIAKRDGGLVFDDTPLSEILHAVERHYGVLINVSETHIHNDHYSVRFTNNETLEQVMSILKDAAGGFSWTAEDLPMQ